MKHPDRPYLVAITGGIASGKSVVSKWFEEQNFAVFHADKIGHDLFNDQYFINKVEDIFGKEITIDGQVNRTKLGEIIFSSAPKRKKLNKLLHPEIRKRLQKIIDNSSNEIIIIEIPLLFENNLQKAFDLVINIWTKEKIQLDRLMKRNMISRKEALQRISSQMPDAEKKRKADVNIENSNSLNSLKDKLISIQLIIEKKKFKEVIDVMEC